LNEDNVGCRFFYLFEVGKKLAKKGVEAGRKGAEKAEEILERLRPPQNK